MHAKLEFGLYQFSVRQVCLHLSGIFLTSRGEPIYVGQRLGNFSASDVLCTKAVAMPGKSWELGNLIPTKFVHLEGKFASYRIKKYIIVGNFPLLVGNLSHISGICNSFSRPGSGVARAFTGELLAHLKGQI